MFIRRKDGKPYYLDAIVWQYEDGGAFTGTVEGITSRQFIRLPFLPKTFYVKLQRVMKTKSLTKRNWKQRLNIMSVGKIFSFFSVKLAQSQLRRKAITHNILLIASSLAGCCTPQAVTKIEVRERIDSVFIPGTTVTLAAPSDTVYIHWTDSTVRVHAHIDTMVNGMHMNLRYEYPPDEWTINIHSRDMVMQYIARDSIINRPYEVIRERVPLWMYVSLVCMVLALIAGIVARR